ncbi:unnamed protein product [Brassica napus]|uniref:(rape) hypothetical protein n=1 Tax=Brassica napus TaxID=3708 RepID=A0A816L8H2_BRANA|nr:unnamed protein product [Brassica napus]
MFELWFREMEATTDPSSPAFSPGWRLLQLCRRPVQVREKGVFLRFTFARFGDECGCFHRSAADEKPKLLGQGYYCSFSAKLEVVTCLGGSGQGGGVLVLMMKLSAEVKSVKSTIRWFSSRRV